MMTSIKKHPFNIKKVSSKINRLALALLLVLFTGGIAHAQKQYDPESGSAAYVAKIKALNSNLTKEHISGQASFVIADGQLNITIVAKGLAPSIMHLQHIHGFKVSGKASSCLGPDADSNGDGIVDLIETHQSSGVTLIPFNAAPTKLKIKSSSYPVANGNGLLTYQMDVPLDALTSAIQNNYDIGELSLEDRVMYIHGVPEGTSLPETVQSLPGVPSLVTVPIACGEIEAL
jgi:hypothetical protein